MPGCSAAKTPLPSQKEEPVNNDSIIQFYPIFFPSRTRPWGMMYRSATITSNCSRLRPRNWRHQLSGGRSFSDEQTSSLVNSYRGIHYLPLTCFVCTELNYFCSNPLPFFSDQLPTHEKQYKFLLPAPGYSFKTVPNWISFLTKVFFPNNFPAVRAIPVMDRKGSATVRAGP